MRLVLLPTFALLGLGLVAGVVATVVASLAMLRSALDRASANIEAARGEASALERLVHHRLARERVAALAPSAAADASPLVIAGEVAGARRRLSGACGALVEVDGDARARVRVDPQDLADMLGNLMETACRFARRQVGVAISAAGGSVTVSVGNDGPGLPGGQRDAVRDRGVRLDERMPGSGLGLEIADLPASHGGSLEIGRAAGGGLLATLRLPRRAAATTT